MTQTNLTPRLFFESVVKPNAAELSKRNNDMRLAVNAMLTLDAFFGILYAQLRARNQPMGFAKDDQYRDHLASSSRDYESSAMHFSIKHGELTGKKARLVQNVSQIQSPLAAFGVWMFGYDRLNETVLLIQMKS